MRTTLFALAIMLCQKAFPQDYSSNNGYEFTPPKGFHETATKRHHTDYKFIDSKRRILILQTFTRTKAEENITPNYYKAKNLQKMYSKNDPQTLVYKLKHLTISGFKAYSAGYSNSSYPSICEMLIYNKNNVYLFVLYTKLNGAMERKNLESIFIKFYSSIVITK